MPFTNNERALLLAAPRIGPRVLQRLEEAGIDSLRELRRIGVDAAVQVVCQQVGSRAWTNRKQALHQVLEAEAA